MYATFNRFEINMTLAQAESAAHSGKCDNDVALLVKVPAIRRQLDKLDPETVRAELREYGAWDSEELSDNEANKLRLVWIAAGNIKEERAQR